MFSVQEKRDIAEKVQQILRETNHPELPSEGEISFLLHVDGAESWSWADIRNNAAISNPSTNPWPDASKLVKRIREYLPSGLFGGKCRGYKIPNATQIMTDLAEACDRLDELEVELKWWHDLINKHHDNEACPNMKTYVENLQAENKGKDAEIERLKTLLRQVQLRFYTADEQGTIAATIDPDLHRRIKESLGNKCPNEQILKEAE